jgi:hypothetical protein
MTDDQDGVEHPEQTAKPPRPRSTSTPSRGRSSAEDADETVADERTSPFPYAEKFDEWVADETAPDEGQRRRKPGG